MKKRKIENEIKIEEVLSEEPNVKEEMGDNESENSENAMKTDGKRIGRKPKVMRHLKIKVKDEISPLENDKKKIMKKNLIRTRNLDKIDGIIPRVARNVDTQKRIVIIKKKDNIKRISVEKRGLPKVAIKVKEKTKR